MKKDKSNNASYRVLKGTRRTWGISPVEKVVASKKDYDRNELKHITKAEIEAEYENYEDDFDWWFNDPCDNEY